MVVSKCVLRPFGSIFSIDQLLSISSLNLKYVFRCVFFDADTSDDRCSAQAKLVDMGTVTCTMPAMRRVRKYVIVKHAKKMGSGRQ
jgi:hypothetical protein